MSTWWYLPIGWVVAQPVLCVAWSRIMRRRREAGGN